jgi:hypothetical protein
MSKTVLICGDGFRVHGRRDRASYGANIPVLEALAGPPLRRLGARLITISDFYRDERVRPLVRLTVGFARDALTWAYRSQVSHPLLDQFYERLVEGIDFVLGFELAPTFVSFCAKAEVPVLDIAIHPFRFLPDLLLMARSPDRRIASHLEEIAWDATERPILLPRTRAEIGAAESIRGRILGDHGGSPLTVFFMQTRFDKSKFDGAGGFVDEIGLIERSGLRPRYYVPHPNEPRPELEYLMRQLGAEKIPTGVGTYDLLSLFADTLTVVAVSSSVLAESRALSVVDVRPLAGFPWVVKGFEELSAPWAMATSSPPFTAIDGRFLSDRFWARVLGQSDMPWNATYQSTEGYLRNAWGEGWGLNGGGK